MGIIALRKSAVSAVRLAVLLFCSTNVHAEIVFNVNSTLDQIDNDLSDGICQTAAGTCTLRAAVMQANRATGAGATVNLPAGVFGLTRPPSSTNGDAVGDLNLSNPVSGSPVINIAGVGAALSIIDANQLDRVIVVDGQRHATLSDLTIRNGFSQNGDGAGIYNAGILTLTRVNVTGNFTQNGLGGGIFHSASSPAIRHDLTIVDSIINGNTAGFGGGIGNEGFLSIVRSTFSDNQGFDGGGLYSKGSTTIRNSTFKSNRATRDAGGIYAQDNALYVINSTLSNNRADHDGGGIVSSESLQTAVTVFLYNTSVVDNDADHDADQSGGIGGGIYAQAGSRFGAVNSLIARNTIITGQLYDDCNGLIESYGTNLLNETSGCTWSNASFGIVSVNTIGPLQNNGGPTFTHALLVGSQAIDSTLNTLGCVDETGAPLNIDQRGDPRVVGPRCDVGAYEFSPVEAPIFVNGFE